MVILSIDTETYESREGELNPILNCQEFKLGAILKESGKILYYENPNKMAESLISLIEKEHKRGGRTFIYAHNCAYDFYSIFRDYLKESMIIEFPNGKVIKYFSFYPFMAMYGYEIEGKMKAEAYFLDTMSYFRTSLKEVGKIVNLEKLEMPEKIKSVDEMKPYLKRDCEIVMKGIKRIKEIVKELGFKPKRFLSAGNTAITCFLTYCNRNGLSGLFSSKGKTFKTEHIELIRPAFRGGRVECFKNGVFDNCIKIDCNALYPYLMMNMDFPYLRYEKYIKGNECLNYIDKIGVIKCTIKPAKNLKYGYLPIRFGKHTFYPKDRILEGVWTSLEIREALKLGYELIDIKWGLFFNKTSINPFKEYMKKLWEIRKTKEGDEKAVVKLLMNSLFGKFSQYRTDDDIKIINRNEIKDYTRRGYEFMKTANNKYIVIKKGEIKMPKYANPMISIWITALARDYMYKQMLKIEPRNLIYIATDGLIIKEMDLRKAGIKIGSELGEFKIEGKGNCKIYGENRYKFNEDIKMGGIPKKDINEDVFEGRKKIKISKIITVKEALKNSSLKDKIGTFIEEEIEISRDCKNDIILPYRINENKEVFKNEEV